jgi:hypothetical protein
VSGEEEDECLLEEAQVVVQIPSEHREIEHGIAHELAGAVVGRLTSAVGAMDGVGKDALLPQAGFITAASHRVDRFMLKKQKVIVGISAHLRGEERFLKFKPLLVSDPAKPSG